MLRRSTLLVFLSVLNQHAFAEESLVIESTTLIDGRTGTAKENVTIVIEGARIAEVGSGDLVRGPADATLVDGRNRWVVPGFIDVHTHNSSEAALARTLALGITSVHLMPTLADKELAHSHRLRPSAHPMPRVHVTPALFSGTFPANVFPPGTWNISTPKSREEVRKALEDLKAGGSQQIKIIQDDGRYWVGQESVVPRLSREVFQELVTYAHRLGMRVYVHATQVRDSRDAILNGADAFMHGSMDARLEDALLEQMAERSMVWTPAFRVILSNADPRGFARRVLADARLKEFLSERSLASLAANMAPGKTWPDSPMQDLLSNGETYLNFLRENTRRAQATGVPVAVGSDGWPGVGMHIEMELLHDAGLSPAEVLAAATYGGAVALGVDDELGTIAPGKLADLVILRSDPLLDIRNARHVEWTVKDGRLFSRQDLLETARTQ